MFKTTALESKFDVRTITHDLAAPVAYTSGGVDYTLHENQRHVGICTAISLIQNIKQATGFDGSADFQYLLQKKFFDGNWTEGSSIFNALKANLKYGTLASSYWTHTIEADRDLPYSQYSEKLMSIPDYEINRLLTLCQKKLTGYAQVDISTKENVAHAIDSSKAGILCRYTVTNRWWQDKTGINTWDPIYIDPLDPTGTVVGGHAITASGYDYTNGNKNILANTWGDSWDVKGNAHVNYDNYKMTEAWIPYFDLVPQPKVLSSFEIFMMALKAYQISKGINDFANEMNPANIMLGNKTLSAIATDRKNYQYKPINTTVNMNIIKSKTTWLAVIVFVINALTYAQGLPLSPTQLEGINALLGILVFVNRHFLPSSSQV